MSLNEMPLPLT